MTSKTKDKTAEHESGRWWLFGALAAVAAGYVGVRLIRDVFSVAGITYALGLGDGRGLTWPAATAALTWVLVIESCAAAGAIANVAGGVRHSGWLVTWAFGHLRFARWLVALLARAGRACWRVGRRFSARSTPDSDGADDFAVFEMPAVLAAEKDSAREPSTAA